MPKLHNIHVARNDNPKVLKIHFIVGNNFSLQKVPYILVGKNDNFKVLKKYHFWQHGSFAKVSQPSLDLHAVCLSEVIQYLNAISDTSRS